MEAMSLLLGFRCRRLADQCSHLALTMTQCQMDAYVIGLRSIAKRELSIGHGELGHIIDATADQIDRLADDNERLRAALLAAKIPHHVCVEDGWYSCPKSGECLDDMSDPTKCYCRADAHNAKIDAAIGAEQIAPVWSMERCRAVDRSNIPATCDWPRCCGERL